MSMLWFHCQFCQISQKYIFLNWHVTLATFYVKRWLKTEAQTKDAETCSTAVVCFLFLATRCFELFWFQQITQLNHHKVLNWACNAPTIKSVRRVRKSGFSSSQMIIVPTLHFSRPEWRSLHCSDVGCCWGNMLLWLIMFDRRKKKKRCRPHEVARNWKASKLLIIKTPKDFLPNL